MADVERLYQFFHKTTPVPDDIVYLGDSQDSFDEVNSTIEEIISAYPNLIGLADLTVGNSSYAYKDAGGIWTAGSINTFGIDILANVTTGPDKVLATDGSSNAELVDTLPVAVMDNITQLGAQSETLDMNGNLVSNALDPLTAQDLATKNYVDMFVSGLTIKSPCRVATTANLTATYDNGVSGVGATLTNSGAMAALSIDGVALSVNDRVVAKDQSTPAENGIYVVTDTGSGATNWIMTRSTDFDTAAEIHPGDYVLVLEGTVNAATSYVQTATVVTVGTDSIVWNQFSSDVNTLITNIQNQTYVYAVDSGAANAYVATLAQPATSYIAGLMVSLKISNTNTAASTLNVNGLGTKAIILNNGSALTGGELVSGSVAQLVYDGTSFQLLDISENFNIEKLCQGRLTLTSGTPVTTANVTGATTLYFTPFRGNFIDIYDGTRWVRYAFSELSIAVPATTSTLYDVFVYNNAGTPALELLAWTNGTTRATALTTQNGVYVKSGDATRRYVGSMYTTGVSGQTADSDSNRFVWNYYNRVMRPLSCNDSTNSWTYSSSTIRQANGSTANQVNYVIGVSEDTVHGLLVVSAQANSLATNAMCGIGINSTTVNSAQTNMGAPQVINTGNVAVTASYNGIPSVGVSYMAWLESNRTNANTVTWYGDNNDPTVIRSGLSAEMWG